MASPYGTASALYGDTDFLYGRLPDPIVEALASSHRATGLRVTVEDTNLNDWAYFTGVEFDPAVYAPDNNPTLQAYRSYRGQAHTIKLSGGNIIRARIGDGTYGDRNIYVQTVTDPTVASQWTSWSLLYSGTHYAVYLIPTGASTYDVCTSKSDGVYINNTKKSNLTGVITLRAGLQVSGDANDLFAIQVIEDPIDGDGKYRDMNLWGTTARSSLSPGTPGSGNELLPSIWNYRWYRFGIAPVYDTVKIPSGLGGILALPLYTDPRARNTGDTLVMMDFDDQLHSVQGPLVVRGLGSGISHNTISGAHLYYDSTSGFYYLFYNEYHSDPDYESTVSPGISIAWQRTKDLYHWTEPVFTGFQSAIGGVIDSGSYVYFTGWGIVYRRPKVSTTYEVSNYVPELELAIPRANQLGSGSLTLLNPAGVNDYIVPLSDKPIKIEIGIRGTDGVYVFYEVDQWWITKTNREIEGATNKIAIEFGNLWARLDNQIRDTFNFIGKTEWEDFKAGAKNQSFNYYFTGDSAPKVEVNALSSRGIVLWTGWKGHSGYLQATFGTVDKKQGLIFRYVDTKNYCKLYYSDSTHLKLVVVIDGVEQVLNGTGLVTSSKTPWVRFNYGEVEVGAIGTGSTSLVTLAEDEIYGKPGYVGFTGGDGSLSVGDFSFYDFEYNLKTKDLIQVALAMGDFHDAKIDNADSKQMSIMWGPQTDLPTIAEALTRALEIEKLELVWRDGFVQVGRFSDPAPIKTLQNEILKTDYQDQASRRINLALVDGNEDTWIEVDAVDSQQRDRQINSYFDVPELLDQASVTSRAQEELRRGKLGRSPGGEIVYQPDLWRMDAVTWVDNEGNSALVRLEGYELEINQSTEPSQIQKWDTSLVES